MSIVAVLKESNYRTHHSLSSPDAQIHKTPTPTHPQKKRKTSFYQNLDTIKRKKRPKHYSKENRRSNSINILPNQQSDIRVQIDNRNSTSEFSQHHTNETSLKHLPPHAQSAMKALLKFSTLSSADQNSLMASLIKKFIRNWNGVPTSICMDETNAFLKTFVECALKEETRDSTNSQNVAANGGKPQVQLQPSKGNSLIMMPTISNSNQMDTNLTYIPASAHSQLNTIKTVPRLWQHSTPKHALNANEHLSVVLQSCFSPLTWPDLIRVARVCCSWRFAVQSKLAWQSAEVDIEHISELNKILNNKLFKHLAAVEILKPASSSVNSFQIKRLAEHFMYLRHFALCQPRSLGGLNCEAFDLLLLRVNSLRTLYLTIDQSHESFLKKLSELHYLEELTLVALVDKKKGMKELSTDLLVNINNLTLSSLSLIHFLITDKFVQSICHSDSKLVQSIITLNFIRTFNWNADRIEHLTVFHKTLKQLRLGNDGRSRSEKSTIQQEWFIPILRQCKIIEAFELGTINFDPEDSYSTLLYELRYCPKIETFWIFNSKGLCSKLTRQLQGIRNLTVLGFLECPDLSDEALKELRFCNKLALLDIRSCSGLSKHVTELLNKMTTEAYCQWPPHMFNSSSVAFNTNTCIFNKAVDSKKLFFDRLDQYCIKKKKRQNSNQNNETVQ